MMVLFSIHRQTPYIQSYGHFSGWIKSTTEKMNSFKQILYAKFANTTEKKTALRIRTIHFGKMGKILMIHKIWLYTND